MVNGALPDAFVVPIRMLTKYFNQNSGNHWKSLEIIGFSRRHHCDVRAGERSCVETGARFDT